MSATLLAQFGDTLLKQLEARNAKTTDVPQAIESTRQSRGDSNTVHDVPAVQPRRENVSEEISSRSQGGIVSGSLLDSITARFGALVAYDGRYCVWTSRDGDRTRDSFDVRDIARKIGCTMHDVVDALPEFKPVKRGKRGDDDNSSDSTES